jgi:hypothetical protein
MNSTWFCAWRSWQNSSESCGHRLGPKHRKFTDATEATDAYGQAELEHLGDKDCEIVLVGADSLDTIRKTHGHYFTKAGAVTLPELAVS